MKPAMLLPLALALLAPPAVRAADAERGRILYESRCTGCHDRSVHDRANRSAHSFEAIRAYVWRWNRELGGDWRQPEIDDVARYLNDRYYRHPCPPDVCQTGHAAARSPTLAKR